MTCTHSGSLANGATERHRPGRGRRADGGAQPSNTTSESDANANDPTPSNNSSTDTATVTPVANLKLTKTLQGSNLQNGQQATYQLAVLEPRPVRCRRAGYRHGPASLRSDLCQCPRKRLDLLLFGQVVTCLNMLFDPCQTNGATTISLTVNVTATSGQLTNAATVSGPTTQTDPSGDRAEITSPFVAPPPATTTTEPATTSATASTNQTAAATPASATSSSGPLATTGASPAALLRITYVLEAAGIALVTAACFGTRRRNATQPTSKRAK